MPDFNVRSDSVNVEQIMEQIRARIREKRGVDYTEQQIRELAAVKLEKFLDPRGLRSDLLAEFRRTEPDPNYEFEDETLFRSTRAPFLRTIRRLLLPVLKLFFNPNPLIQALHVQSRINEITAHRHQLYYELIHNLVVEVTRLGIEVKNLRMRVESLDARVDFNERRARALEGAVIYRSEPQAQPPPARPAPDRSAARPAPPAPDRSAARPAPPAPPVQAAVEPMPGGAPGAGPIPEGAGQRSRRRRRRRGRRSGAPPASSVMGPGGTAAGAADEPAEGGTGADDSHGPWAGAPADTDERADDGPPSPTHAEDDSPDDEQ